MDDGRVFYSSIPVIFPYITLSSIILVVFLSFLIIIKIVYRWDKRYQTGVAIIVIISLSSIIKSMSDGGPFAYDFLIALNVVYIFVNSSSPEHLIEFIKEKWRIIFWCLFLAFSIICFIDSSLSIFTYTIKNFFTVFMMYFAIYLLTIKDSIKRRWWVAMLIFLFIFFSNSFYSRYSIYIKPFLLYLDKGTRINYFYYKDRPQPKHLKHCPSIFDSDFLTIYTIKIENKVRPIEIYKAFSENPFRNRHIAIMASNIRQSYGIISEILFIDFKNKKTSLRVPNILHLKLTKNETQKERFYLETSFDPTYFPQLSHAEEDKITQIDENHKFVMYYFLNRFFYHYGIKEYILTPMAFYRFN